MRFSKISFLIISSVIILVSCQKEYSLEGSLIKLPKGTWQFNDSNRLFRGNIDTAYIDTSAPTKILQLQGPSLAGTETFSLRLLSTDSFKLGMYHASLVESEFDYSSLSNSIYQTDILTGEFIVTVTQLANNHISGIFSGTVLDSVGNPKQITLGKFTSAIKLKQVASSSNASGFLGSSSGSCTPVTTSGVYTQGVILDPTNTIQVFVTVTTPGTYTISTNTVNGVTFSKSGLFAANGGQTLLLTGSGTPVNSGTLNFTISFGSSTCSFSINFLVGTPPPPVLDYFPMTLNSNWTYYFTTNSFPGLITDSSVVKVISYNPLFAGNTYNSFEQNTIPPSSPIDTTFYRKQGNDYYEYTDQSNAFAFTNPTFAEYIQLKDNVAQGTTWQSQNFTGTIPSLGAVTGYIIMTLTAKAVPVTLGTQNFPDVMKVRYDYYITLMSGSPFRTEEKWFARGVGLIHHDIEFGQTIMDVNRYTIY